MSGLRWPWVVGPGALGTWRAENVSDPSIGGSRIRVVVDQQLIERKPERSGVRSDAVAEAAEEHGVGRLAVAEQRTEHGVDAVCALARRADFAEADTASRVAREHERRVLGLQLKAELRRREPEALRRRAGAQVVGRVARLAVGDDGEVGSAAQSRDQLELQARQERSAEP